MMKTPDELDFEMNARLEQRDEVDDARELEEEVEGEPKQPKHKGIMKRIEEALDRSPETELRADQER